jgi:hypothetical protein
MLDGWLVTGWALLCLALTLLGTAGAVGLVRVAVPLILIQERTPYPGRFERYLPLQGRWLRFAIGTVLLLAGLTLASVAGISALVGLTFCLGSIQFGCT